MDLFRYKKCILLKVIKIKILCRLRISQAYFSNLSKLFETKELAENYKESWFKENKFREKDYYVHFEDVELITEEDIVEQNI